MKTIDAYLVKKIKFMNGQVIAIGCSDAVLNAISENDHITTCYDLNNISKVSGKYKAKGRVRNININKFKRKFKKKRTKTMIVNILDVLDFSRQFVPSSVYMTKELIYLYTNKKNEKVDLMIKKYHRYHTSIEEIELKDGMIYKIDCSNTKQSRIKDLGYSVKDMVDKAMDILGDYLIN